MDRLRFSYNGAWWDNLNYFALFAAIMLNINASWIIARWTQMALKVTERNAMLAAGAFLQPFADIFLFLEDAVSVQIGYAIGAGDTKAIRVILNIGVMGGVVLGTLAASLTTVLAYWPSAIETLLAPGHHTVAGCALVPTAAEVVEDTRLFWLLASWSWPFAFANLALGGFLLGTREYGPFFIANLLSKAALYGVWMTGTHQDLNLLAWAGLVSNAVFFLASTGAILGYRPIRSEYGIVGPRDLLRFEALSSPSSCVAELFKQHASVLRQGAQAMVLDLSIQICMSSGVYLAGAMGLEVLYQVSALQAAMPLYVGCVGGIAYNMKLVSSVQIGRRLYRDFYYFARAMMVVTLLYAVGVVAATHPFRVPLAFMYAPQACAFASEPGCAGLYVGVFGSGLDNQGGSLQESFSVLAPAAVVASIFSVLKSGVSGCFDFAFMAKSGVAVLFLVYAPALGIVWYRARTPAALFIAMYLPVGVLCVVFAWRLFANASRMVKGDPGPWLVSPGFASEPGGSDEPKLGG